MKFQTAIIFIGSVFVSSLILTYIGIAQRFEYVDIPLHFLGGMGWAMIAAMLIIKSTKSNQPKWFNFLFTVGLVMIIGTLWEFSEFTLKHFIGLQTWRDTLGDLLNDELGAIAGWYLFIKNL